MHEGKELANCVVFKSSGSWLVGTLSFLWKTSSKTSIFSFFSVKKLHRFCKKFRQRGTSVKVAVDVCVFAVIRQLLTGQTSLVCLCCCRSVVTEGLWLAWGTYLVFFGVRSYGPSKWDFLGSACQHVKYGKKQGAHCVKCFFLYLPLEDGNQSGNGNPQRFFCFLYECCDKFPKTVISRDFYLFSIVHLVLCFWLDKNTGEFFSDSAVNFLKTLDKLLFTDLKDIFLCLLRALS